ncbi:MAG: phosphoribosyltransferase family protein [Candidatus Gribaldobacteria bacterium]|nr:phosphoribosyltransferase family protein [Candidatus Gribaldobacteria bacterium]
MSLILETIFPRFCLNCDEEGKLICEDCLSLIEINDFVYCPFCEQPNRLLNGKGVCQKHYGKFLDGLYFATSYRNKIVKKIITQFKYEPYLKTLSPIIAFLIISHLIKTKNQAFWQGGENFLIIPTPLTSHKKRSRGYNQAEVIAGELASVLPIALNIDCLIKIKETPSQVGLSLEQRQKNIQGVFLVKNSEQIAGKKIFLVDDVFTTGATMQECARVLKLSGAKSVWGITLAREPLS